MGTSRTTYKERFASLARVRYDRVNGRTDEKARRQEMKGAELEPTSNSLPANREEAGELITPEQADQWEVSALQAIEDVQDPDQADELLKRITLAEQAIKLSKLSGD